MESVTYRWVKGEKNPQQHTHDEQMSRLLYHTNRAGTEGRFKTNKCMETQWKHTCTYEHTYITVAYGKNAADRRYMSPHSEMRVHVEAASIYMIIRITSKAAVTDSLSMDLHFHTNKQTQQHVHSISGCNQHISVIYEPLEWYPVFPIIKHIICH